MKKAEQAEALRALGLDEAEAEFVVKNSAVAAQLRHQARVSAVQAEVGHLGQLAGLLLLRMEEAARGRRLIKTPPTIAWVGGGSMRRHASDGGAWAAAIAHAASIAARKLGESADDPYLAATAVATFFFGRGSDVRWAMESATAVALDGERHKTVRAAAAQAAYLLAAQAESDSAWVTGHFECPVCGAAAGWPCHAPNGALAPLAHLGRVALLEEAGSAASEPVATGEEPVANEETATEEVAAEAGE